MDLKEMRGLTKEELLQKERELKKELFNLRFQVIAGKIENPARTRQVKREIARIKTVYCEKEREEGLHKAVSGEVQGSGAGHG